MAAHVVTEFPISESKTVFAGTPDEDIAYLKIFWKSVHLNPTIESRLVSSDVRQRIAPHPIKSHEKQKFKFREEDPPKLDEYAKHVFKLESEDQHRKRMGLLDKREADLARHRRRKDRREKVQTASHQTQVVAAETFPVLPPISCEYNDDLDPEQERLLEAMAALVDIEKFDRQIDDRPYCKQPVDETAISLK